MLRQAETSHYHNFAYLFLLDIDRFLLHKQGLESFEAREPGYTKAILNAFLEAFSPKNIKLNLKMILNIHAMAMSHVQSCEKGVYKDSDNNFSVAVCDEHHQILVGTPTASIAGLKEFIERCFLEEEKPSHHLAFTKFHNNRPIDALALITSYSDGKKQILFIRRQGQKPPVKIDYSHKDHFKFIQQAIENEYIINIESSDIEEAYQHLGSHRKLIEKKLGHSLEKLNTGLAEAKSDDQKISEIAGFVQRFIQIHPFLADGNTRTAHILLQWLLHDNNLPLSLVINPNRLDCFSNAELVAIIKEGQKQFIELTQLNVPQFRHETLKKELKPAKPLLLNQENSKIEAFVEKVIKANHLRQRLSLLSPSSTKFTLFGQEEKSPSLTIDIVGQHDKLLRSYVIHSSAKQASWHCLHELVQSKDFGLKDKSVNHYRIASSWLALLQEVNPEALNQIQDLLSENDQASFSELFDQPLVSPFNLMVLGK